MKMEEVEKHEAEEAKHTKMAHEHKEEEEEGEEETFHFDQFHLVLSSISSEKETITTTSIQRLMREVLKIFSILGRAFGFVKADIEMKMAQILTVVHENREIARENGSPEDGPDFPYHYLNTAMQKEKNDGGEKPFSNALLRQRRLIAFLEKLLSIMKEKPQLTLSEAARDAYNAILAEVHIWAIRMAVKVGVYALPTKETFLALLEVPQDQIDEKLDAILSHLSNLTANMYSLFNDHGLQDWR